MTTTDDDAPINYLDIEPEYIDGLFELLHGFGVVKKDTDGFWMLTKMGRKVLESRAKEKKQ